MPQFPSPSSTGRWLHSFPHVDFAFGSVSSTPPAFIKENHYGRNYVEALVFISVGMFLLGLIYLIVELSCVCKCCGKRQSKENEYKRLPDTAETASAMRIKRMAWIISYCVVSFLVLLFASLAFGENKKVDSAMGHVRSTLNGLVDTYDTVLDLGKSLDGVALAATLAIAIITKISTLPAAQQQQAQQAQSFLLSAHEDVEQYMDIINGIGFDSGVKTFNSASKEAYGPSSYTMLLLIILSFLAVGFVLVGILYYCKEFGSGADYEDQCLVGASQPCVRCCKCAPETAKKWTRGCIEALVLLLFVGGWAAASMQLGASVGVGDVCMDIPAFALRQAEAYLSPQDVQTVKHYLFCEINVLNPLKEFIDTALQNFTSSNDPLDDLQSYAKSVGDSSLSDEIDGIQKSVKIAVSVCALLLERLVCTHFQEDVVYVTRNVCHPALEALYVLLSLQAALIASVFALRCLTRSSACECALCWKSNRRGSLVQPVADAAQPNSRKG